MPPWGEKYLAWALESKMHGSYWIPGSWNLRMVYTEDIPCPKP
jgi:hypothetical protein